MERAVWGHEVLRQRFGKRVANRMCLLFAPVLSRGCVTTLATGLECARRSASAINKCHRKMRKSLLERAGV